MKLFKSFLISFLFLSFFIGLVNANELYVDDDKIDGWYDNTHIKTIQEGITNSTDNDTIYVYNGTYIEDVLINKNISLLQYDKNDNPYIIGKITIGTFLYSGVNVSGFDIFKNENSAIAINKCYYVNISYCNMTSDNFPYVLYMRSRYCNISNNNIYSFYAFNTILVFSCLNSGDFDYTGNNMFYYNNINGNNVTDYGIYLAENTGSDILTKNIIQYSGLNYGLFIEDYITNTLIYNNNFIGNTLHAYGSSSNTWNYSYGSYPNNVIGGNYWNDGNTTDVYHNESQNISGNDGIVDKNGGLDIYYIWDSVETKNSKDYYPLLHPYGYVAPLPPTPEPEREISFWGNHDPFVGIGIILLMIIALLKFKSKYLDNKKNTKRKKHEK